MLFFFDDLNIKNKGMLYFSLPVSPLERISVAFTFVIVIFPTLMFLVFTVFDYCYVQLYNHIHGTWKQTSSILVFSSLSLGFLSLASAAMWRSLKFGTKKTWHNLVSFPLFILILRFVFKISFIKIFNICALIFPVFWIMMYYAMKKREV